MKRLPYCLCFFIFYYTNFSSILFENGEIRNTFKMVDRGKRITDVVIFPIKMRKLVHNIFFNKPVYPGSICELKLFNPI